MRIKVGKNSINSELLEKIKNNSFYKDITEVFELDSIIITEAIGDNDIIHYTTFSKSGKCHSKSYDSFERAVIGGLTTEFEGFDSKADYYFLKMINYNN